MGGEHAREENEIDVCRKGEISKKDYRTHIWIYGEREAKRERFGF
jgi:hypothetical protein